MTSEGNSASPAHVDALPLANGIRGDLGPVVWDKAIAQLSGHALQTSLWGEGRSVCDGIESQYVAVVENYSVVWAARIETRKIPGIGRVGWIPRGPCATSTSGAVIPDQVINELRRSLDVIVTDPWFADPGADPKVDLGRPRTIWLDLSVGETALWSNFKKVFRYKIRRAEKAGIISRLASQPSDIARYSEILQGIEATKGFKGRTSQAFITHLLASSNARQEVQAMLWLAESKGQIGAGLFLIRVGTSLFRISGAADRAFGSEPLGLALDWTVLRWAVQEGYRRYDLEGMDPVNNAGVYQYKRQFSGEEVTLIGKQFLACTIKGRILVPAIRWLS